MRLGFHSPLPPYITRTLWALTFEYLPLHRWCLRRNSRAQHVRSEFWSHPTSSLLWSIVNFSQNLSHTRCITSLIWQLIHFDLPICSQRAYELRAYVVIYLWSLGLCYFWSYCQRSFKLGLGRLNRISILYECRLKCYCGHDYVRGCYHGALYAFILSSSG